MVRFLKRGLDASTVAAGDAKVRSIVEGILADVETRGDAAVRELSERFDNWSPQNFRLSDREIENALSEVAGSDLDDIRFAGGLGRRRGHQSVHEFQRRFRRFGHLVFDLPGSEVRKSEQLALLGAKLCDAL